MNNFTKLILTSAIISISGFATEGLLGEHNQNGNYNLKNDYSIESTGRLNMLSGSMTISSEKTLTNKGIVDISKITDFTGYSGHVQGESNSSIIIPKKSAEVTPGDNALNCDGEYKLTYASREANLQVVGREIKIQTSENGIYTDAFEASTKLGLTFDGTVTMDPQRKDSMTMDELVAHSENKVENNDKTFDISQQGLSSTNIILDSDKTIHFGLIGSNAKNINLIGAHKLTISGDSSGMEGKITTEGDLSFGDSGSKGALEVQGKLSYAPDTETTVNSEVKVGSLFIPQNSKLTVNGSMTIGYAVLSTVYYGYNYPWVMNWRQQQEMPMVII